MPQYIAFRVTQTLYSFTHVGMRIEVQLPGDVRAMVLMEVTTEEQMA